MRFDFDLRRCNLFNARKVWRHSEVVPTIQARDRTHAWTGMASLLRTAQPRRL